MRFEDLSWQDVESYLQHDTRLMLILGACEQHAGLSLLSDVRIPQALADAAAKQTGVLVAPPLNFGASPYFLAYPGTLSLRLSTLLDLVEDLVHSAYGYGFRRILVINGHGGNDPARGRLYEVANALPSLRLSWYAWWTSHSVDEVAIKHGLKPSHASWLENFPFTRLGPAPEAVKQPPVVPGLMDASTAREVYGDGSFGGPYQVDDAIMDELFQASLLDILQLLKFE
jgi:creatinine amidohydrolase